MDRIPFLFCIELKSIQPHRDQNSLSRIRTWNANEEETHPTNKIHHCTETTLRVDCVLLSITMKILTLTPFPLLFLCKIAFNAKLLTHAFCGGDPGGIGARGSKSALFQFYTESDPSDYDAADLTGEKSVAVDENEADSIIRDDLKRELLLLSSVTNRGEYASPDEQNIIVDIVAQLEALNPTADPASNCQGEWDLALSSTQFFRSSPFFQSIRVAMGENNKAMAENAFDIHDRATTASRVGRVRQTISDTKLLSEVELEVGLLPGFPIRVKGTVITSATLDVVSPETWETRIIETHVKGSNIPIINEFLDDARFEIPVSNIYNTLQGQVPVVPMKTFYLDEGVRITRDIDDNIFVFTRA